MAVRSLLIMLSVIILLSIADCVIRYVLPLFKFWAFVAVIMAVWEGSSLVAVKAALAQPLMKYFTDAVQLPVTQRALQSFSNALNMWFNEVWRRDTENSTQESQLSSELSPPNEHKTD